MNRRSECTETASRAAGDSAPAAERENGNGRNFQQTVGIQVGAASFVDEGTEGVLDVLEERASVNTLYVATFSYGRGIAGRQIPGFPPPDHGKQEENPPFHGGNYSTPHPEFYRNTVLKHTKAPDHGDYDVIESVIPAAKKRGMKTYCWAEDVWRTDIPNVEVCQEVDIHGRKAPTLCLNNPEYHNFLLGLMEDLTRSYDIDGIMWGSERCGAFCNAFESIHFAQGRDPGVTTCFCRFCQDKARRRGIDVDRAREGFLVLEDWVLNARKGERPADGYWVSFWRILFRYPELIAWEAMGNEGVHEAYRDIYDLVKSIRPSVEVGWHIWHAHSFSPFFRAQTDLRSIARHSDYLKMTVYHNAIGGPRLGIYIDSVASTIFRDMPKDEALKFNYRVLDYYECDTVEDLYRSAFSPDYVFRETRRSVNGVAGTDTRILAGIDVDIPSHDIPPEAHYTQCTPEGTRDNILAAYRGGAHGLVISRKYSEMRLANLSAVGDTLRELRLV
jgi:hypothetical protein